MLCKSAQGMLIAVEKARELLGGGKEAATRDVYLPREPFELFVRRHGIGIDKRNRLCTVKVKCGTGELVEVLALAEYVIEKRFAKGNHDFGSDKGKFLC